MKRKAIAILLAALTVSLCSCRADEKPSQPTHDTGTASSTETAEPTAKQEATTKPSGEPTTEAETSTKVEPTTKKERPTEKTTETRTTNKAPSEERTTEVHEPQTNASGEPILPVSTDGQDPTVLAIYEKYGFTKLRYTEAVLPKTPPADDEYMDSIVYLCDSTLYHLYSKELVKRTQIWTGREGTQTLAYQSSYEIYDPYDRVDRPIREVARLHTPKRMVICLGVNGIDWMSPSDVYNEFCDLIDGIRKASPQTEIIIQSILPMSTEMRNWSRASFTNKTITAANAEILRAATVKGVRYLDTFSVLIGENGLLKKEYNRDGLHLQRDGLLTVLDYIRTHKSGQA